MKTRFTELFEISRPIALAPMGGVAGGALAAAVSRAGGLGFIGCGYGNPKAGYGSREWIAEQFALVGNERMGAGFITWSLAADPDLLDFVLEFGADPIFLSFGDPAPFVPRIRAAGRRLVLQVASLAEAVAAKALEPDLIVAQGTEAGGHGMQKRSLFALLPAIVDAVDPIPVLAAGSISDGRGLAAAMMLGAEGALLGTRFFATHEALGSEEMKMRILAASGDATVRTRVFDIVRGLDWPEQYTGRAIGNAFLHSWHGRESELAANIGKEAPLYDAARKAGDLDVAVLFAGEGVDLINSCKPAGDVVARIADEAEALLQAR